MTIKGLLFDINGTLIDINTEEGNSDLYRILSNLFSYQGISLAPDTVKDLYSQLLKEQHRMSLEHHPEFDAVAIFREMLNRNETDFTKLAPAGKLEWLPLIMAEVFRAASRFKLHPYPGVEDTLKNLRPKFKMGIVSDGQTSYAVPELRAVGLLRYFDPVIVSGDFGYRKPDKRLFETALSAMKLDPSEVVFIGNDMYHDVHGAKHLGMKTVFFKSNQGKQEYEGTSPDYIIYNFSELIKAINFFEKR